MEPIERELQDRKERRKRLAIELQALEATPAPRKAVERAEREYALAGMRYRLDLLGASIAEYEEIIAEGPNPPRIPRPSLAAQRRLSAAERQAIAEEARANLPEGLQGVDVQITVEPVTGPDGAAHVSISVGGPSGL